VGEIWQFSTFNSGFGKPTKLQAVTPRNWDLSAKHPSLCVVRGVVNSPFRAKPISHCLAAVVVLAESGLLTDKDEPKSVSGCKARLTKCQNQWASLGIDGAVEIH